MDYNTSDLLNRIDNNDHLKAKEIFSNIMNDKILSEIGAKKIEIAKTLLPSNDTPQSEIAINKIKDMQNYD